MDVLALSVERLADPPRPNHLFPGLHVSEIAVVLGEHILLPALANGIYDLLTFGEIVAGRDFAKHVLSAFQGGNRVLRMK